MMGFYKQYQAQGHEVRCEIQMDYDKRIVHILDTNEDGTMTVTNGISFFLAKQIMKDIEIDNFDSVKWICYGTDGVPAEYWNPGFQSVPEELLYPPFQQRSLEYIS